MKVLRILIPLLVVFWIAFGSGLFGNVLTDAATRLAYELKAGAKQLNKSDKSEWEVEHLPVSSPEGIDGAYQITLQAVKHDNNGINGSGSLTVENIGGKYYGTSYHLRFVTVTKELKIRKKKGETTYLTLRKTGVADDDKLRGNQEVEVISIR